MKTVDGLLLVLADDCTDQQLIEVVRAAGELPGVVSVEPLGSNPESQILCARERRKANQRDHERFNRNPAQK